ncbi:MAG: sigma-70 family RNA polymerase sigma factor [Pseudomonadota bacterium]
MARNDAAFRRRSVPTPRVRGRCHQGRSPLESPALDHFQGIIRITSSNDTDEALLLRFQRHGDRRAFDVVYERYRKSLLSFTVGLSGNQAVAEEVSQQAWLQLLEATERGTFTPGAGASFRAYLYTMARNRYIDDYCRRPQPVRSEKLAGGQALEETLASEDAAFGGAAAEQGRARLLAALAELPLEQREVIAMWSAGMSAEEVASATGAPRNTVLSRKRYALKKLKESLGTTARSLLDG